MRKSWIFALFFSIFVSGTALAADVKPILKKASIEVSPNQDGVEVVEQITLTNVEAVKNGKIEHLLTLFENIEVQNIDIKSGDQKLTVDTVEGTMIDKLIVSVPQGTTGDFSYSISYHIAKNADSSKVPIIVPAIASDGKGNFVSLKLNIPDGQYLQESFPLLNAGDTGSLQNDYMNIPNFLNVQIGAAPGGFFTASNIYTLIGVLIILGIMIAWIVNENKGSKGGSVHV